MALRHLKQIFRNEFKVMSSDKKALVIFLLGPVITMLLVGSATSHIRSQEEVMHMNIAIVDEDQSVLSNKLVARFEESSHATVKHKTDRATAEQLLKGGKIDAIVVIYKEFDKKIRAFFLYPSESQKARVDIIVDNSVMYVPMSAPLVLQDVMKTFFLQDVPGEVSPKLPAGQQISADLVQQVVARLNPVFINVEPAYGTNVPYFSLILPTLIPMVLFLFALMMSGMSIVSERVRGTLPRLFKTPVRRSEIVIGKLLAYFAIALWHGFVVTVFPLAFGATVKGGIHLLFASAFLTSYAGCTWGMFYSTFAKTEREVLDYNTDTFLIVFTLAGILIPSRLMRPIMQTIANILPLSHSSNAVRCVIIRGLGIEWVIGDMAYLFAVGTVMLILALVSFKFVKE